MLTSGISVGLGIAMNSQSVTFNNFRAIPLRQPKEDVSSDSVYQSRQDYSAIATEKSQYAELDVVALQQYSGSTRI